MTHPIQNNSGWSPTAGKLWKATRPLCGTPAETYLSNRRCYVPDVKDLRFLAANDGKPPALVARLTDFYSGDPLSLQLIDLDPATGKKQRKRFLTGCNTKNGVVRLEPLGRSLQAPLGLCEGIEDALSIIRYREHASFPIGPVWATCGTSTLGSLKRPPLLGDLVIWADNDAAGDKAAKKFADAWIGVDIDVRIVPPKSADDWNDDLKMEGL